MKDKRVAKFVARIGELQHGTRPDHNVPCSLRVGFDNSAALVRSDRIKNFSEGPTIHQIAMNFYASALRPLDQVVAIQEKTRKSLVMYGNRGESFEPLRFS